MVEEIKKLCGNPPDLCIRDFYVGIKKISIIFFDSTSSSDVVTDSIVKSITLINKSSKNIFNDIYKNLKNNLFNSRLVKVKNIKEGYYYISNGFTLVIVDNKILAFETRNNLDRGVTESTSEPIIRGPKDSFTENNNKNLGLIRKRLKDDKLRFSELNIGRRTKSKITIGYIEDIADLKKVKAIENKLKQIDIDGILESGYVREFLIKDKSSFPQILSTERPDLTCQSLLDGKIIILTENTPYVLIIPGFFTDFLHTPDDYFLNSTNTSFNRILKFICFFATLLIPALYILFTTYNQDSIPDKLLISLAVQREGVPFSTVAEILVLVTVFEVLREIDMRMPSKMGTAISIVGAIILGQAAVDAGICSPITVIIVAAASVCCLIFTDLDFIDALRLWRFLFIIFSSLLGIIGLLTITMIFINRLCNLKLIDYNYIEETSKVDNFLKKPINKINKRSSAINNKNLIRLRYKL